MKKEERGFTHRIVGSETTSIQGDDGYWTVIAKMYEKISSDGENWEEASLEVMQIGMDLEKAFGDTTVSIVNMFKTEVLEKGHLSIVDAKRASEMEKENGSKGKDTKDS